MGLFDSLFDLASDVVKIVVTPVDLVVSVAGAITKPIAEVTKTLADDIKSALN